MLRNIIPFLLLISFTQGQSLITYDDFETGNQGWQICYPPTHTNSWMFGTGAGNGISSPGTTSVYVTQDGTTFGYGSSALSEEKIIIWKQFNTTGHNNGFILSFDWKGYGQYDIDALYFAMCFSNPTISTNWFISSSAMALTTNWENKTFIINSPTIMNNNPNLKIGFIFKYNNITVNTPSFAIDNFRLVANQSPLSINDTITINNPYLNNNNDNPIIQITDITGKIITQPNHGVYFITRKYGKPQKIIIQ